MMLKSPRHLVAAFALMTAVGCGDDDGGTEPTGTIAVSASPTALTLAQGTSGTVTVTLVRGGGFSAPVSVAVSGLPAGVTASVSPSPLTGAATQATVTVNVAGTVVPGTYTATVTASAAGVGSATTTYNLTVTAAPSVTLSMGPATLSLAQGTSGTSTLTATRSNYAGNITPTVTGNPAGMTVSFNPTPMTGNTSTVTVTVGSGVAVGNHTLTITGGTGGAAGSPTTTLTVTVTQSSSSNLTWDFCSSDDLPLKFWKQDGGTWTEVTPTVVGNVTRYTFTISSAQGGVAFTVSNTSAALRSASLTATGFRSVAKETRFKALKNGMKMRSQNVALTSPFFDTFVYLALASELGTFAETCETAPATVSKTFNVTGQAAEEEGLLGYGGATALLSSATPSYNLNVVAGTYDWLAAWGPQPDFPDLAHDWSNYRIGRGEAAPGSAVAVNRTGAPSFVSFPFTATGGATGSLWNFSQDLEGARGQVVSLPLGSLLNQTGTGNMLFPQPADRLASDLWSLTLTNTELSGTNTIFRSQVRYIGSAPPASGNFALAQEVPPFTTSQVAGAPVPTWMSTGQIATDYRTATSVVSTSFTGGGGGQRYTIAASYGWLAANGMTTTYSLTAPTLPGFLQAWAPAAPLDDSMVIMAGTNATGAPTAGTIVNIAFRLQDP
jgi:hypothetical protein